MKLFDYLRDLILEEARFEALLDKYATKKKDPKTGNVIDPLIELPQLAELIFADPTIKKPNDLDVEDISAENLSRTQPGKYTNWIINSYLNPPKKEGDTVKLKMGTPEWRRETAEHRRLFLEDLYALKQDLAKFNKIKEYLPIDKKDIGLYTPRSLSQYMGEVQLPESVLAKLGYNQIKKVVKKERKGFSHPGADVLYSGNKWTLIRISDRGKLGQEAASWYGGYHDYEHGESKWCTSPPESRAFMTHIVDGPLYVILPNDPSLPVGERTGLPVERYQIHFPTGQFKDRHDSEVNNQIGMLNGSMSELKEYLKPEMVKFVIPPKSTTVNVEYPGRGWMGKFFAIYGLNVLFDNLPPNTSSLMISNTSDDSVQIDVPPSIGKYTNLGSLMLMKCVKSLPNDVCKLKNLTFLSLPHNNSLTSIPDCITELPNLEIVNLNNTPVKLSKKFFNTFKKSDDGENIYVRI